MSRPLERGQEVAPGHRVLRHLRRGEDTDVYDAWSEERTCRVIVKTLVPGTTSTSARRRLLAEGRHLLALTHPNLVRAYEVHTRPRTAIVLETLTGETLGHLIADVGRLPVAEIGALGAQLCSVVGYLHRADLLHLDIKPSNLVCQDTQTKLLDLGIARRPGPVRRGFGTPVYLSPEQASGRRVSAATDVWGIGVTLWEAATGELPFGVTGVRPERPQVAIRTRRRLPRDLAAAIDGCLARDPRERPTVAELAPTMLQLAGDEGAALAAL